MMGIEIVTVLIMNLIVGSINTSNNFNKMNADHFALDDYHTDNDNMDRVGSTNNVLIMAMVMIRL